MGAASSPAEADAGFPDIAHLLAATGLKPVIERARQGRRTARIALIDGVVDVTHPVFSQSAIEQAETLTPPSRHATFIASMHVGRGDRVLGIAPGCTLLSLPVDLSGMTSLMGTRHVIDLIAQAISAASIARADVIQISLDFDPERSEEFGPVVDAIAVASTRRAITVVAAGNGPNAAASAVLLAPGVIPVVAMFERGHRAGGAGISPAVAIRGLQAPGTRIPGAAPRAAYRTASGSSYAAAFVAGAAALLRSIVPDAPAARVTEALVGPLPRRPTSMIPPALDAGGALERLMNGGLGDDRYLERA